MSFKSTKRRIAIHLVGVGDLSGGGGVERFWADFFQLYAKFSKASFELILITDRPSLDNLRRVGKLNDPSPKIIVTRTYKNRFKTLLESAQILWALMRYRIKVLHCANYMVPQLEDLTALRNQRIHRFKLVQNIADCQVPYVLGDVSNVSYDGYFARYVNSLHALRFDGIFSWYELYEQFMSEKGLIPNRTLVRCIQSRFTDTKRFKPLPKRKEIVFAGRLTEQKRPLWFVDAVAELYHRNPDRVSQWQFRLFGDGPDKEKVRSQIEGKGLSSIIELNRQGNMASVFGTSMIFVSTQDFENFPSSSMMEAMACENIIVARDVGQTNLMVEDGENGLLIEPDSVGGLADTLEALMEKSSEEHARMMKASGRLVSEVHTFPNFALQIESFWDELLTKG